MQKINTYIDHTLLNPMATKDDIITLCNEAMDNNFYAVCVNSYYVPLAKKKLKGSSVKVCSVVGFPLGAMSTAAKVAEALQAINDGADEIDMVMNIGLLKSQDFDCVWKDMEAVKKAIGDKVLKVILETCYLDKAEIIKASEMALLSGADYVKTSTGFGPAGATFSDVKLIKSVVMLQAKVKASGGIKDRKSTEAYISLGVDRIGTSSGIAILNSEE